MLLIGRLAPRDPKLEVAIEYAEGERRRPRGTVWYATYVLAEVNDVVRESVSEFASNLGGRLVVESFAR
jgi:hypothetical protein